MSANPDPRKRDEAAAAQRRRAVRMALWLAALAMTVYFAFLLTGVLGR